MSKYLIYKVQERDNNNFLQLIKYRVVIPMIASSYVELRDAQLIHPITRLQNNNFSSSRELYILEKNILKSFEAEDDDSAKLIFECEDFV